MHNSFPSNGKPQEGTWTTLAALLSLQEPPEGEPIDDKHFTLIALTTGTRCVTGTPATLANAVLDCHAEVLLKRAFKRFLIGRLLALKRQTTEEKEKAGEDASAPVQVDLSPLLGLKYYLFVSQLPCGIAHRYQGEEEPKCNSLRRKPGKGEPFNAPSCIDKLARWLRFGLQGRRLLQVIKKPITLSGIVIGNCTVEKEWDEGYLKERLSLSETLSRRWNPNAVQVETVTEPLAKKARTDDPNDFWNENINETIELLFNKKFVDQALTRTKDLVPFPTSLVLWREEFEKGQGKWKMGREMVTAGRRSGSSFTSYQANPLKICNNLLDQDIDTVFKEYGIRRPKTEEEDFILQYEKKWKELKKTTRFKGWKRDIPSKPS